MSTTITVVEAERQLREAQAIEERQKREAAKQEVKRLAAEGAKLKTEVELLAPQIRSALSKRLRLNAELVRAKNKIAHYAQPLDPLGFPTEAAERERLAQLAFWRQRQRELLAENTRNEQEHLSLDARGHGIDSVKRLNDLQHEINNWSALAEGRKPGQLPEGGLSTVGEDLLGHSDRRFD